MLNKFELIWDNELILQATSTLDEFITQVCISCSSFTVIGVEFQADDFFVNLF